MVDTLAVDPYNVNCIPLIAS